MEYARTDVYQFQVALTSRLMRWAEVSVVGGLIATLLGDRFWQGLGLQSAAWGFIDGIIAWIGGRGAMKRAAQPEQHTAVQQAEERGKLRRVLWINTGLDVLYITGGWLLARTRGRQDAFARGTGWGIVLQGGFLFIFDLLHALHLSPKR